VADQQIETLWLGHFKSDPEHQDPFLILAALARPIPLDYVSVGAAFSLVGHWIGRPLFAAIDEVLFPSRSQNSRS
jgi:hypothetical protein